MDSPTIEVFARLLGDVHQALIRDHTRRSLHNDASQIADREDQPHDQSNIRHIVTDRDPAVNGHEGGVDEPKEHLRTKHNIRKRPEERVHQQQELALDVLEPVILVEFFLLVVLPREGFDHAHAGQVFLQGRGKYRFLRLIIFVGFRHFFEEPKRDPQNGRNDHHRQQTQLHVDVEDRRPVDEKQQDNASHTNGLLREKAAQRIYIRGDAFDQITRWCGAVIRKA